MLVRRSTLAALVLGGGALMRPAAAVAQTKFQLVPYFVSYYAATNFYDEKISPTIRLVQSQTAGPGLGARARVWLNPRFGVEGSFALIFTDRSGRDPDSTALPGASVNGNAILASGRLLFQPRRSNLHFLAGAGVMRVGGDAYSSKSLGTGISVNKTNWTAVVGVGTRASVTPKFAFDLGIEANLYTVDRFDVSATSGLPESGSKFQADFLLSIGIPIGGR
jgi:hypothetical protein